MVSQQVAVSPYDEHQLDKSGRRAARHRLHQDQYENGREAARTAGFARDVDVQRALDYHRGRKGAYHRGYADELASFLQ
jgi:hypothetical protein